MRSRQRWSRLQFWPFQLQTDASDSDVGAVLLQEGHPLAIVSKSLAPHTRLLSIYEEYLAILVAVEQCDLIYNMSSLPSTRTNTVSCMSPTNAYILSGS